MGFVKMMFKTSCIASHLHYNYIFMHFRYVLYMLNCLYDVRIGLGWAHDVFKFACHMFMHFHAYVPSCFYLLILNMFDTFLILTHSLSLSLSLSLSYVSCIMASKRKSTLSLNLFCSGVSSSSPFDPTPSHVWFHDEKAKSNFLENFSRWGIHSENEVIPSNFSDIDFPTDIYSRGWGSLCDIQVTCPSMII